MDIKKITNWLFEHLDNIVVLFSILGGAAVFIISALSSLPPHLLAIVIIFVVLGVFALLFTGLNQYRKYKAGRIKKITELNDEEIEKTIRDWLVVNPMYTFKNAPLPDYFFRFIVTDKQGRPVTISRNKSEPHILTIATAITLSKDHRIIHDAINKYQKKKISCTLRIEMDRYRISQEGIDVKLEKAVLSDCMLLDDSLNDFYLRQRVFYVTGAFALYSTVLERELMLIDEQDNRKEGS